MVKDSMKKHNFCFALMLGFAVAWSTGANGTDLEGNAFPEFDIWIGLDEEQKNRIFILNSYADEPSFEYNETALGISWDQRFHESWSWRAGVRYIDKQVDPPDANETRGVLDLKWFKPLGSEWLLTDRNRLDLRWFDGNYDMSFRYRNRLMIEKPFVIANYTMTGFASYEAYFDSRYSKVIQRNRFIAGVSFPCTKWASVDLFYGYHIESAPKHETGGAIGVAFGFYFIKANSFAERNMSYDEQESAVPPPP